MRHRIVILGGGTGGTLAANRLHKLCGDSVEIVVVDRDDRHAYQPGFLFVPFGLADPRKLVRSRRAAAPGHRVPHRRGRARRHRREQQQERLLTITLDEALRHAGMVLSVLATIQGNQPGVYVQGVTIVAGSSGSFTIHLNEATPVNLPVAWFVLS